MSLIGPHGLQQIAEQCHKNTVALINGLTQINGVKQIFTTPYFHEALLQFEQPIEPILNELKARGIDGGYPVENHYPEFANSLLICATEMRTEQEINFYINELTSMMK
jgi:glycine dehydrogenase subunit 1